MKINFKNSFITALLVVVVLLVFANNSFAVVQTSGQNIGVTVDNSLVVVPETPTILRSENIAANTLDLVVEVGNDFSSEMLDFFVTITNTITGDITTVSYTQLTNSSSQTTLNLTGLDPGTEYSFVVKYKRDLSSVYSANSDPHTATTLIDSPVLDSIDNITTDSASLHVIIDPVFIGSNMDFIIEVSNGSTYTIQTTKNITSSNVVLVVDGLDSDTNYTFKVKYAREGTLNYSEYSNELSITTESDDETLDKPKIDEINNVTTNSMDVVVKVDGRGGEKLDFVLQVTNKATGASITIDYTETVGSNDKVVLGVGGLTPGTEYEFKVKYALDGDDAYSDYSSSKTERTKYVDDEGDTVTICHKSVTITIKESELQNYLNQGAVVGSCKDNEDDDGDKVTICHDGDETIKVSKSELDDYLNRGDELGECEEDKLSGATVDVDDELILREQKKEEAKEIIIPEEKKGGYEKAAIVGAAAGTTAVLASSAIPLFAMMPGALGSTIFVNILQLFGIIGRRKEERNWGVVFNSETKLPIPAVKIVLLDKTGKEMITTYSDKEGRFGFLVSSGEYMIEVFKRDYTLVTEETHDELYGKVYDGKSVRIGDDHIMTTNIAMRADNVDWQEFSKKRHAQYNSGFAVFAKYFFISIYAIGFFATIIITYFYPSVFNFVVLGIYIAIFVYRIFFSKKKYGLVETGEGKPIAFAVVNLYDKDTKKKENFAVTDSVGRYYLLADNGTYILKAKGQPASGKQFEKSGNVQVKDGIVRKDIIV